MDIDKLKADHKVSAEKYKNYFSSKLKEEVRESLGYTAAVVHAGCSGGINAAKDYTKTATQAGIISQRMGDKIMRRSLIQSAVNVEIESLTREGNVCPKVTTGLTCFGDVIKSIAAYGKS